jgi:NADPH:quinone reductase-like Zn-dependent oxidoreductase
MNRAFEVNHTRPVIDRVFKLSEARAAFEHMENGSHFGKIVLSLRS